MVRYIIVALIAFILLALLGIWVMSGGPRKIVTGTKQSLHNLNPLSNDVGFHLPWQPVQLFPTLDITDALNSGGDSSSAKGQLANLEAEYDRLNAEAQQTRTFGNPSPFIGQIAIVEDIAGVRAGTEDEYIQIAADYRNTDAIDITGWTLESALTGVRVVVPPAASPFVANSANVLGPTALDPGGLALVATAQSPIGISFRENMCSGYLQQFQEFSPPLSEECPSPSSVLPLTGYNLEQYGDSCFDAIENLSACRFPHNLSGVSTPCRAYLTESLSYNGCVSQNRFRSSFQKNMWRVYLGAPGDLWRNSHDAIRLLDGQGRTVSVFVY